MPCEDTDFTWWCEECGAVNNNHVNKTECAKCKEPRKGGEKRTF